MKPYQLGVVVAVACLLSTTRLAQNATAQMPDEKQCYFLVKITGWDRSSSADVFTREEFARFQERIKLEASVQPDAFNLAVAELRERQKARPSAPLRRLPPSRTFAVVRQSYNRAEVDTLLEKENRKIDAAKAKGLKEIAAEEKRIDGLKNIDKEQKEERKAKLKAKLKAETEAYAVFSSKIDDLVTAKERALEK